MGLNLMEFLSATMGFFMKVFSGCHLMIFAISWRSPHLPIAIAIRVGFDQLRSKITWYFCQVFSANIWMPFQPTIVFSFSQK